VKEISNVARQQDPVQKRPPISETNLWASDHRKGSLVHLGSYVTVYQEPPNCHMSDENRVLAVEIA